MNYSDRWKIIKVLGEGGQGKVYLVLDKSKFNVEKQLQPNLIQSIKTFTGISTQESLDKHFDLFRRGIVDLIHMEDPSNHGALKVLHEPKDATNATKANTRIEREIKAMGNTSHPNLLKIWDRDSDSKWFVSQYHHKGTLHQNLDKFKGDFPKALRAFRALVVGVSELHKQKIVHRDIKPQNVFLESSDNLILGDFGLVFFIDERHTRISDTLENVGSHDWMPVWAMGMRVEDIKPSFDVFSLGKLLWSMISGSPFLLLWYFEESQFNLEKMFPNSQLIKLANPLFEKCIVEKEKDCLPNATALLEEVDRVLSIIDNNADQIDPQIERLCKVCGLGVYKLTVNRNPIDAENVFGIRSGNKLKIFTCIHCGNVQFFAFLGGKRNPSAWNEK